MSYPNFWPKTSLTRVVWCYVYTPSGPDRSLHFQWKFRQRGILKYLIFDSESCPLLSVFLFFIVFLISIFYFLINVNFVYKNLYLIKILFVHILLFSLFFLISILTISNSPSTVFFLCPNPSYGMSELAWPHPQHKLRNIPIQSQSFCIFQTNPNLKSTL